MMTKTLLYYLYTLRKNWHCFNAQTVCDRSVHNNIYRPSICDRLLTGQKQCTPKRKMAQQNIAK